MARHAARAAEARRRRQRLTRAGRRAIRCAGRRPRAGGAKPLRITPFRCIAAALVAAALAAPAASAQSADVAALQVALRAQGPLRRDDRRRARAADERGACARFQARRGLVVDGIAGPATRRALGRRGRPRLGAARARARARAAGTSPALQFLLAPPRLPVRPGRRRPRAAHRRGAAALPGLGRARPPTASPARRRSSRLRAPAAAQPAASSPRPSRRRSATASARAATRSTPASTTRCRPAPGRAPPGRGCVSFAGWSCGGYGNLVVIAAPARHDVLVRAPVARSACGAGACVVAGNPIGRAGSTGPLDRPAPALRAAAARRGGAAALLAPAAPVGRRPSADP